MIPKNLCGRWDGFFHLVNHLVVNHVAPIWLDFVFFDRLELNRDVILGCIIRRGQLSVSMKVACCIDIVANGGVPDALASDGFSADEGDGVTCQEVVAGLDVLVRQARVLVESDLLDPT